MMKAYPALFWTSCAHVREATVYFPDDRIIDPAVGPDFMPAWEFGMFDHRYGYHVSGLENVFFSFPKQGRAEKQKGRAALKHLKNHTGTQINSDLYRSHGEIFIRYLIISYLHKTFKIMCNLQYTFPKHFYQ